MQKNIYSIFSNFSNFLILIQCKDGWYLDGNGCHTDCVSINKYKVGPPTNFCATCHNTCLSCLNGNFD